MVVSNGNLLVGLKKKVNDKTKNKITVMVPVNQLEKMMLSGSGIIKSDGKLEVASSCKGQDHQSLNHFFLKKNACHVQVFFCL